MRGASCVARAAFSRHALNPMARKNRPPAPPPLPARPETLSSSGVKLFGLGGLILASGFFGMLRLASVDGTNAAAFAAPILILSAYAVIGRAALMTTDALGGDSIADPAADSSRAVIPGIGVFLATLAAYVHAMCPTMYARDSAELATAIRVLGIPHAPGYPTYILFGKILDLLPLGNPAYRANLAAAFFAAGAAALCFWIIWRLTRDRMAGIAGGLVLAFSAAFWKQATAAEVFSLAAAFLLTQMLIQFLWLERPRAGLLWLNAMIFGLSLGSHQILLFQLPSAAFAVWVRRDKVSDLRTWALAFAFFLTGFAVHLFLPMRALQSPLMNHGDPSTISRLVRTLTRADYGSLKLSAGKSDVTRNRFEHSVIMARSAASQFTPIGVFLACVGVIGLFMTRPFVAICLVLSLLSFGPGFMWVAAMPVDADTLALIERFYWPTWCLLSILIGVGVSSCITRLAGSPDSWKRPALAAISLILPAWLAVKDTHDLSLRQSFYAYDLMQDVFKGLPRNAVFFTVTDTVTHGSYYLQFAQKQRLDVKVVGETAYPPKRNPELYDPTRGADPAAAKMLAMVTDPVLAVILNGNIGLSPIFIEGIFPGLDDFVAPVGLTHRVVADAALRVKAKIVLDGLSVHEVQAQRGGFRESSDPFVRQIFFNYYAARYNSGVILNMAGHKQLASRELAIADHLKTISAPADVYSRLTDALER